jgi:hypothetical protein
MTQEQKRLLQDFGRQERPETYAAADDDDGFFSRLKGALR